MKNRTFPSRRKTEVLSREADWAKTKESAIKSRGKASKKYDVQRDPKGETFRRTGAIKREILGSIQGGSLKKLREKCWPAGTR